MHVAKGLFCILMLLGSSIAASYGSPNLETFDAESDTASWSIADINGGAVYGSTNWVDLGGAHGGFLQVSGAASPTNRMDIIYTTDPGLATGLDENGFAIKFDFYSAADTPAQTFAYFESGSGDAWFADVSSSTVAGDWASIYASLDWGSWFNLDGRNASQFAIDRSDIAQIGAMIYYVNDVPDQVFGIDNFDVVPEPATWAFLGIAFLSVGYSFRERLDQALSSLMVRIKG